MESFEDGTLLPRNSGSATSAYSLESYASSETPGADYTALNDKVYLAGMASLAEGIIDRLSIKHLVVMSSVPDAVVRQVWRMSRLECRVSSSHHFYEALPQIIGFVEMASYDMGERVLILSKNGNRRGAAVGIAFCMKMNGWRLQWAIHRMLVKRRSVNLPPDYSRALEMWEKDGCPTVV